MSLAKADIIEDIHKNCGFTKSKSADVTESILEIIKHSFESGEDVLISGFGKFCVKEKKNGKEKPCNRGRFDVGIEEGGYFQVLPGP